MRVAIVAESFLPNVNGVTNSVLRVLQHLEREGHQALVLAPGDPPASAHGARVVALPVVAAYQTDVAGFATRYHLAAAADAAWRRIRSIHDRAELTLAPSRSAVGDLTAHGVERVVLWPRGVDTGAFSAVHRDEAWRAALAPRGEVLVGYLGRLAPEKQVEDLVALRNLPRTRLVVIGDGPERERLQRLLPDAVFLGQLGGSALSRAVAGLDVGVQTGPYETFCQAAQETMASGVPVVAVAAGGVADLVHSSRTGWLYPPGDLDALRDRVGDLVGDAAKRQAMGRAATAAVRGRTWPVVCEQLLDHYRTAVARHRATSGAPG